jgi:hypothetical protein
LSSAKATLPDGAHVNATHLFAKTAPVEGVIGIVRRLRLKNYVMVFRVSLQPNSLFVGAEARDLVKELGASDGGVDATSRLKNADAHLPGA